YQSKYKEVPKHQHKRALVLTARKFTRLVDTLLRKHQLYTPPRIQNFQYLLMSVILMSSLIAMLLQYMAAKLGIVSQMDLAQAIRA
uniref:divalent metal cation transporter n=1 Tax=Enterococcus faecium TaxID=1352 RepID=UPI00292CADD7